MDQEPGGDRRTPRASHDLAYVLGEGGSVGRSRLVQDAIGVAPLVLVNAAFTLSLYAALIARASTRWDAYLIVGPALAAIPVIVMLVLVSLREHEQPITVSAFVTVVASAMVIAVLSAARVFISYSAALTCVVATALFMMLVALRLQQAETERIALLDFPGADFALRRLGGKVRVITDPKEDITGVDRLLIDLPSHYTAGWSRFLLRAYMRQVLVTPWVQFLEKRRGRVDIETFDVADVVLRPSQVLYSRFKRAVDIAGVLVALVPALILGGLTYIYILLRAGRPVFFTQQRRGYGGRNFTIVKFRTMHANAALHSALEGDDRIVPALRFVRRFRLDEIPQLLNIWRGDMSFIGPRPATVKVAEAAEAAEPKYASRLLVRPGLTGWAQVNSGYARTTEEEIEKLAYDLYYLKRLSFDLDLLIVARTLRIVVLGANKV